MIKSDFKAVFGNQSLALFQMYYAGTSYTAVTQYFTYGIFSLVADFGGYLGLFMGHSILTFYDSLTRFVEGYIFGNHKKTAPRT